MVGAAIIGLIALGNCLIFAQGSTAAISGLVRDATGAVVPGVTVTAKNVESGLTRTAVSSENGGRPIRVSSCAQGPRRTRRRFANISKQSFPSRLLAQAIDELYESPVVGLVPR
jgi:Carboxypeptidase regulatory-like domain